jgi:hypothetical protein
MLYCNRKDIVRILAEKPDMMSDFPECVLSVQQLSDMARIPHIVLCDSTMTGGYIGIEHVIARGRPDAVLPALVYSGVERVRWSDVDAVFPAMKKNLERTWHVHVLPPVVLGSPLFRSALCMYADMHTQLQGARVLHCAACIFYRMAVCIPLCKQANITRLNSGQLAPCCAVASSALAVGLLKYCAILLKGYGISLDMQLPVQCHEGCDDEDDGDAHTAVFECFTCSLCIPTAQQTSLREDILERYFEKFAIPLASNIISTVLSGRAVDCIATARALIPKSRKK